MLPIYVLAVLAHAAFSLDIPCIENQEISSQYIKDPAELIGDWSYVYHWDNTNKFNIEPPSNASDHELECPKIVIVPVELDSVKEKQDKCGKDPMPFKWEDAKLKLVAPLMHLKDSIIFMGEKDSWLMVDCKKMIRVEAKKISDDLILMLNPDVAQISELLSKKPMKYSELKCLSQNIDVGKGLSGIGMCSQS